MAILLDKRDDGSIALLIDGDLQFDSRDERIYHEALTLPALAISERRKPGKRRALIVGGGDGLTARELLKSETIASIDLVDYDAGVISLAQAELKEINGSSLSDPRVTTHIEDAWKFVERAIGLGTKYDIAVVDLTVAQDASGARFHSMDWYAMLARLLASDGLLAANGVSPSATPTAYWSVYNSLVASGLCGLPYRIFVPSFAQMGYGYDWGFLLGSPTRINAQELDDELVLPAPRQILTDPAQIRQLFEFPAELFEYQSQAMPARLGSEILLHYFYNSEEITPRRLSTWNALAADLTNLYIPEPDTGEYLLPPEIRACLAETGDNANFEETLFERVLHLMPALNRFQTRQLVREFLESPAAFLEAIDLGGLVERLLRRAAELPGKLVEELKLLRDKLSEWSGNYLSLLDMGMRVMTIVTAVVVLGNLLYPDAAYGKGEHGGGGHGGDHGGHGGDHGGRGDHGDRGDRGDRGFGGRGFGDRGFGNRGFDHHWGHWGAWGGGWGARGGWARPWHRYWGGGWGGWGGGWGGGWSGWGLPLAGGLNLSLGSNNNSTTIDEQGNQYPANNYSYQPNCAVANTWNGDTDSSPSDEQPVQNQSNYRLGPDTDILPDGKVVMQITDGAYLLLTPDKTQVIDQKSGKLAMTLYSDPSMRWHIANEINRQKHGIQSALESKQGGLDNPNASGYPQQGGDAQKELAQMKQYSALLDQASQTIGSVPDSPPDPLRPPVSGAFEVFSGVWMLADGSYLLVKRPDGTVDYLNGSGWYSDKGTTKLDGPYPAKFKSIVASYLTNMASQADSAKASLQKDQDEAQQHLQQLQSDLQQYTPSDNGSSTDDQVQFGPDQTTKPEALRRTKMQIKRTQHRLNVIQNELQTIPTETDAANKLLANLK